MEPNHVLLKVGNTTNPQKLSGSISNSLLNSGFKDEVTIRTVGAGALNQAIKAVILANKALVKVGKYATIFPAFADVKMEADEKTITAIELRIRVVSL